MHTKTIYETKTRLHHIKVLEEKSIRKLIFGGGFCSEQSAIDLKNPTRHVFDYSLLAMHSLVISPNPKNILVIGLGGGVIPTDMERNTKANIDIIEIDEAVLGIAKFYFYFKETERTKVYIGDAFTTIKKMNRKYDIIIIDAFLSNYIPFSIMSKEFFSSVFNVSSEDCVVCVNMANVHHYFYSQINTIRSVFGDNLYYIDGVNNKNTTMLFALKNKNVDRFKKTDRKFLYLNPNKIKITEKISNAKVISIFNV